MAKYFVNRNAQPNGDHEVHREGCRYMPLPQNRDPLGEHVMCQTAVNQARVRYPRANGCATCSPTCHTS